MIAAHAPGLDDVLDRAHAAGLPFVCLDGTLVPTDRVAARAERGHHLWYSGKHHAFGGNVQVVFDPTGFPLWVDRKSTRLNSSHANISYAVFCLKKKKNTDANHQDT